MACTFEIQKKDGYILLNSSGTLDSVEAIESRRQAMQEAAAQFNCRRVILDERAVSKTLDPHDLSVLAESISDDFENRLKVAAVYSPENVSKLRWIETFFRNRSLAYRQFDSLQEAEQWLTGSSC